MLKTPDIWQNNSVWIRSTGNRKPIISFLELVMIINIANRTNSHRISRHKLVKPGTWKYCYQRMDGHCPCPDAVPLCWCHPSGVAERDKVNMGYWYWSTLDKPARLRFKINQNNFVQILRWQCCMYNQPLLFYLACQKSVDLFFLWQLHKHGIV